MSDARRLAAEIGALRKQVRALSTVAGLSSSSVEDGSMPVYDEDGNLRQVIGQQDDGAFTTRDFNNPPPPVPADPVVGSGPGTITVECTGATADGSAWPSDFDRIEVHVSIVAGFTPVDATQWHAFHTRKGGIVTLNGVPGTTYHVRLVAVNTSNVESQPSAEVAGVPDEVVADLSGIQQQIDDANAAVDQAQSDADAAAAAATAAQSAADAAQSTADNAVTAASAAQGDADAAAAAAAAAQGDADAAQSTADAAASAASTAQSDADAAASAAADAAGIAEGKADVLIQSTAPTADMQKATTLWIDTTGGANTPKKWDGTGWVAVTDKAATDAAAAAAAADSKADAAQSAADAAQSAADAAQGTADAAQSAAAAADAKAVDAQGTADAAQTAADNAASAAQSAQNTADGAVSAASAAQSAADAANSAAAAAQSDADAANTAASGAQSTASQALSDANNITATQILDDAILTRHLTAGAVTAAEIGAAAVIAGKIDAGAVEAGNIAAGAVTAGTIAAGAVEAGTIAAGAVDTAELAAGAVEAGKIAAGAVVAGNLAAGAVVAGNIAAEAVEAGNIAAGAVVAGTVAADAIGAEAIAADAVRTEHLYAEAVTAAELAAGAVIAGKIDAGAVEAGTIAAGAVQAGNIAADAVEANTIASGAVLTDALAAEAVTTAKLAALAVTADKIAANAIVAGKIDAGAVEAGTLAAGAVEAGNVAAGAIGATEIAADSIEVRHLKVVGINGVSNPSFESGLEPHFWNIIDGFDISLSSTVHHSGTQAFRCAFPTAFASGSYPSTAVVVTANGYFADPEVHPRVQPGEVWRFGYFVRAEALTAATGLYAGVQVCDSNGTILTYADSAVVNVVDDQWVEVSVDVKVPEDMFNALYVNGAVRVDHAAAGDVVLIDDMSLVRKAGASLIVDGAIDGQTITGAFFRTAESGTRIEINNPADQYGLAGMLAFYNEDPDWDPGILWSGYTAGPPDVGRLTLQGPAPSDGSVSPAQIAMTTSTDGLRQITVAAETISTTGEIVVNTGLKIGGTNQRLLRGFDYGSKDATTDGSGRVQINHQIGQTPIAILVFPNAGGSSYRWGEVESQRNATSFLVDVENPDGTAVPNTAVSFGWLALY